MSIYLDASVIVSLFVNDAFQQRADAAFRSRPDSIVVSNFAAAEFASSIARRVRMQEMTASQARDAFADLDRWVVSDVQWVDASPFDITTATNYMRRLDLPLRAPDAIHIAMTLRLGAELATFDARMAECARALGAPLVTM